MKRITLLLIALTLAGCVPPIGAASAWTLTTLLSLFLAASAWAGATMLPPPCPGIEHQWCESNRIKSKCYPQAAKVNFAYRPYVDCGYGSCVPGKDPSLCTPRQPRYDAGKTKADCHSSMWKQACIHGKPTGACIVRVPTNYTGPSNNPRFSICKTPLGDKCSTARNAPNACYPTREEMGKTACTNGFAFRKVCIQTHVTERCMPALKADAAPTPFVTCANDRCAPTKAQCPR